MKYWRAAAPGGGNVHANFLRGKGDYMKDLDTVLFNYSQLFPKLKNVYSCIIFLSLKLNHFLFKTHKIAQL